MKSRRIGAEAGPRLGGKLKRSLLLSCLMVSSLTPLHAATFLQTVSRNGSNASDHNPRTPRSSVLLIPKGYVPLDSIARSQGYTLRYDSGPDVYRMTNGSHTVVIGPGMLHSLIDGRAHGLTGRPVYVNGHIAVPTALSGHLSRLGSRSVSSRFGYSGAPGVGTVSLRRVVIDAGHGGKDPGAIGRRGYKEKTINLQVATLLAQILRAKGVQVVMTRTTDRFIDLHRRGHIANTAQADLFISIHANGSRSRWANGVETFYLSPRISDSSRARRAASMYDGRAFGYQYRTASSERSAFQRGLRRNRYLSKCLGSHVQKRLVASSGETNRGLKTKNLCVLRETYIPAVLVELGFISNSKTEIRFRSSSYRRRLATAIAAGISDYSRHHPSRRGVYASRPASTRPTSASARSSRIASSPALAAIPARGRSGLLGYSRR